jgi:hypothetical protein
MGPLLNTTGESDVHWQKEGTHLLLVPARNGAEDRCLFVVVVED